MPKTWEQIRREQAQRGQRARFKNWEWKKKRDERRTFNRDQYVASEINGGG